MGRVVVEQGAPGHFQFQWRDGKRRFPNHDPRVTLLEVRCARRQRHDQVILLRERHGGLVVTGKNAYLSLLTLFCQRGIDPAESVLGMILLLKNIVKTKFQEPTKGEFFLKLPHPQR